MFDWLYDLEFGLVRVVDKPESRGRVVLSERVETYSFPVCLLERWDL